MIIFIEGPDRVGKSTQIQLLKTYLTIQTENPTHMLHYSYFKKMASEDSYKNSKLLYEDMFKILNLINRKTESNVILDRSHIGEFVYSPLYRNYDASYVFEIETKFNWLMNNSKLIIFINDDINELWNRNDSNSLSNNNKELIREEMIAFRNAYDKTNIKNKLLLNVTGRTVESIHSEIRGFIDASKL